MSNSPSSGGRSGTTDFRESPLLFDLTGRAEIAVTGRDRGEFLHGLLTNDVKKLRPGDGCAAALLTPKGKMRADLVVLCREEELVLDAEAALSRPLDAMLRGYVFFQQVTVENRTDVTGVLHVEGTGAGEILRKVIGQGSPVEPHGNVNVGGTLVVRESRGGFEGFDLRVARGDIGSLRASLLSAGAVPADPSLLESARIEAGIPRWGAELTEAVLPDEAGLTTRGWVSYTKGCYIGQETVARIRTYGHVNRSLVGLLLPDGEAPAPGTDVLFGAQKAGEVTSAVRSARLSRVVALAYVHRDHAEPATSLSVSLPGASAEAVVTSFPIDG
jgi:folate-binding protein YgfZ